MKKDLFVITIILFLIVILVNGTKIQSVEEYYQANIDKVTDESKTVFLSIDVSTILDNYELLDDHLKDEKYVPANGIILAQTEYLLRQGDTVSDVLFRALRHEQIHFDYTSAYFSAFSSVYIKGINHIYEFSVGPLSGWMYRVNGKFPNYGVDLYVLNDQDVIEFVFTCDLGRDVKGGFG